MNKPVVMTPEEEDKTAGVNRSFDGTVHSEETPVKVIAREFHSVTSEFTYLPLPSEIINWASGDEPNNLYSSKSK